MKMKYFSNQTYKCSSPHVFTFSIYQITRLIRNERMFLGRKDGMKLAREFMNKYDMTLPESEIVNLIKREYGKTH